MPASGIRITQKAVSKHAAGIFGQLDLAPSDDDNRRVLAVLAYLGSGRAWTPDGRRMNRMDGELRRAAEAATGFMPSAEGLALFNAAASYSRRGPVLEI